MRCQVRWCRVLGVVGSGAIRCCRAIRCKVKQGEENMETKYIMIIAFIVIVGIISTAGYFVDEKVAIDALHKQGFTDVNITDKSWLFVDFQGCGEDDAVKFTATAKNPRNETVEIYVCAGWLKGATIRS